jgi:hypothetical protein
MQAITEVLARLSGKQFAQGRLTAGEGGHLEVRNPARNEVIGHIAVATPPRSQRQSPLLLPSGVRGSINPRGYAPTPCTRWGA